MASGLETASPSTGHDAPPRDSFYLHPGRIFASPTPAAVTTILGSCVAVCLWDDETGVGGINHYLLPEGKAEGASALRFANGALPRLLSKLVELGARRATLSAKIFGGACVLEAFRGAGSDLGSRNVDVAEDFLSSERIPVLAQDVRGQSGRKLIFHTEDGSAWVRKL